MAHHNPVKRLGQFIQLERSDLGILLAYGVGIGFLSLATPVAVQALVNTIAFGALLQPLLVLTLILLVLLAFSNTLVGLQFYVVEMLQRRLFVRFLGESALRLQRVDHRVRDTQHLPELTNRFLDVVNLQKASASLLLETLGYVLQTLIGMILLAFYHPMLLAFDLFLIAALYSILFVLAKGGIDSAIEQSRVKYSAVAWLETIASNALLVKSRQGAQFVEQQTRHLADEYLQACVGHFRVLWRQNFAALVVHTLANTLLLGMGGWMVIERQLSLGQLIAAELVVNAMVYGFTRIGKTLDNVYELLASVDKIGYLLDLPQESDQGQASLPATAAYQLDLVGLSVAKHPQYDHLQQLNLHLAAGEQLVITHGAEHGTLLDLIYGLRTPSAGRISLDEQDLRDLHLGTLRDSVVLLRDKEFIEASILDNLSLGRTLPQAELRKVLHQLGLMDELLALPEGLNSRLTLSGAPLSDAQGLKLMLARALLGQPRILLIDKLLDGLSADDLNSVLPLLRQPSAFSLLIISQHPQVIAAFSRQAMIQSGQLIETQGAQS